MRLEKLDQRGGDLQGPLAVLALGLDQDQAAADLLALLVTLDPLPLQGRSTVMVGTSESRLRRSQVRPRISPCRRPRARATAQRASHTSPLAALSARSPSARARGFVVRFRAAGASASLATFRGLLALLCDLEGTGRDPVDLQNRRRRQSTGRGEVGAQALQALGSEPVEADLPDTRVDVGAELGAVALQGARLTPLRGDGRHPVPQPLLEGL